MKNWLSEVHRSGFVLFLLLFAVIASNVTNDDIWIMPLIIIVFASWIVYLLILYEDSMEENELLSKTIQTLEEHNDELRSLHGLS